MAVFNNVLAGAAGQAGGAAGYEIERSLRFNNADSSYLSFQPSSAGNRKTWTWAGWFKPSNIGGTGSSGGHSLFSVRTGSGDSGLTDFIYNTDGTLLLTGAATTFRITTAKFRDFSAWYHIVLQLDTTQATAADRIKIYVNGSRITEFSTNNNPAQNADLAINNATLHKIGGYSNVYLAGYLADVHFIDGQALDPTDFGEFDDNGVWQPIEYTGTYGTNGFYLPFSDNSSAAALGTDTSGNGNDWTVNNFSANEINYASSGTNAVNGVIPNGGNPYWIDFLPTNADLDYDAGADGMHRVHDGSTTTEVYWVGTQYSSGNVTRARFDLRDYPTITSLRVYGGFSTNYVNYDYQLLDSSKTPISGTSGTFGAVGWHSLTILGSPRYLEISTTSGNSRRHRLYAIEVNGTVLVSGNPANNDSFFDSPTNGTQTDTGAGGEVSGNYCTLNPLDFAMTAGSISNFVTNGNLTKTDVLNTYGKVRATMPVHFGGKTYFEVNVSGAPTGADYIGFEPSDKAIVSANGFSSGDLGFRATGYKSPGGASYGSAWSSGDVLGFYFDDETSGGIVGYYLNGVDQGTAWSGFDQSKKYLIAIQDWSNGATAVFDFNFGQRPFAYNNPGTNRPSSDFKALCTTNLPDPTIADGSDYFDAALWTGNGTSQSITGLEFSPDLVWVKGRNAANGHNLQNTISGTDKFLQTHTTSAEGTNTTKITAFNSDGFSLGSNAGVNNNNDTYVGWAWDAGTSTVSNTDGSITSSVRANPSAGFSIVSYSGNSTTGATVGHGLNAKPGLIIVKSRTVQSSNSNWNLWHKNLANSQYLTFTTGTPLAGAWANTPPTNSVFSLTNYQIQNATGDYIAYCFAPVEGYSAFGSYTGNGSTDGPFVYTGFRPAFVLYKRTDSTSDWYLDDYKRDGYNFANKNLYANLSNTESTGSFIDFLSNGFKLRTSSSLRNASGGTYLYACFSENPFKYARAR